MPSVRDVEAGKQHPLRSYQAMKEDTRSEEVAEAILLGLAQDDNEEDPSQRAGEPSVSEAGRRGLAGV